MNDDTRLNPSVDIVLATYNGERFLSEQVDSILNQDYSNIHLWIRDDGSKDNTIAVINKKIREYPGKISLIPSENNLGVIGNFSALLEATTAKYVMLSDQDDVWLPNKITKTLQCMLDAEKNHGKAHPLLIHTDLKVVEQSLNPIHSSFWEYTQLFPQKGHKLNHLLMQNVITGCTVMVNRSLLKLALPIPLDCAMHDWWLGLVASSLGHIESVNEPTILYRQHLSNVLGAQKTNLMSYIKKLVSRPKETINKVISILQKQKKQANQLRVRYSERLTDSQVQMLDAFCKLDTNNRMRSLFLMMKYKFFKQNLTRILLTFCLFLSYPPFKILDRTK